MCDKHKHGSGVNEFWITDKDSRFLSSKCVVLHEGEKMPMHTTGPGKEEVIVCCAGSIKVKTDMRTGPPHSVEWSRRGKQGVEFKMYQGEAVFIPANTKHSVHFNKAGADHAIYVYVVNKALHPDVHLRDEVESAMCRADEGLAQLKSVDYEGVEMSLKCIMREARSCLKNRGAK